jgi:translation initiation factor IF-2
MNITDLARRLRANADELRAKLPELGFDIGQKALKIQDRDVGAITNAWNEFKKRQYLQKKMEDQKARADRKQAVVSGTAEEIEIPNVISVRQFSELLNLPIAKVMQELMRSGILASLNESLDYDTASIIAEDLGYIAKRKESTGEVETSAKEERLAEVLGGQEKHMLVARPPVVVIMGHVDHGKTLLLDTIRNTNVMGGEAGGITQHIGAYQVDRNGRKITFIDTPGHEAFTVMRSRGAKVADVAILVIAADDGVKPQTREAIDIIKASGMPYVVAINKIDKEGANIERVKGELTEFNMIPEDYGGKTICVPVSAKAATNIDKLLDTVLLVADIDTDKIMADPGRLAIGTIIESRVDKGQGPVATVLVQAGTLRAGDILGVNGINFGKVRAMKTWDGKEVKEALPSMPVRVLGFKDAPSVGDVMEVAEKEALLEKLKAHASKQSGAGDITVTKSKSTENVDDSERVSLPLIIKSDVLGSLEAILGMLEKIDNPYVQVKIVSRGLGNVTDSEVMQAEATGALLLAFNVKPTKTAEILARDKKVEIGRYTVIYKLFEDIVEKLRLLIPAETVYTELGSAKILAVFKKLEKGMVVGAQITKGKAQIGATARVLRGGQVIGEGSIKGLQSGRQSVKFVEQGTECGIEFSGKTKIEVDDVLDIYSEEEHARTLDVKGAKNS